MEDKIAPLLRQFIEGSSNSIDLSDEVARMREFVEALERNNDNVRRALQDLHRRGHGMSRQELRRLQQILGVGSRQSRNLRLALASERVRAISSTAAQRLGRLFLISARFPPWWIPALVVVIGIALVAGIWYLTQRDQAPAQVAGVVNCDCASIDAGLLTAAYQEVCREREQQLRTLAAQNRLGLRLRADRTIREGEVCDVVAQGDAAWPAVGKPCPRNAEACRED